MAMAERIRIMRVKRGNLSERDLAARMGDTPQNLNNKMKRDDFRESELQKIAGLLKVFTVALAGCKAYHGRLKNMTETIPEYAVIQEDITDRLEAWIVQKTKK